MNQPPEFPIRMAKFNGWRLALAVALMALCFSGCCNCRRGGGLFSNISSARIAPPGTGTLQTPQVAEAPYYNRNSGSAAAQPSINTQQGWRPAGANPLANPNPYQLNPTTYQTLPAAPFRSIPPDNITTAGNISALQTGATGVTTYPAVNGTNSNVAMVQSDTLTGGMPITDATRLAAPGVNMAQPSMVSSNSGIFNRTWEYVARPTASPYGTVGGAPISTAPANSVVATSSTRPFDGPTINPSAPGTYSSTAANGWRQRDSYNNVPR